MKAMPSLQDLTGQYPVLCCLGEWLSTLDLVHLARTSKHHYDHILASESIYRTLKRTALCDGKGLARRQNFQIPYSAGPYNYISGNRGHIREDEPIEVQLWATKCDEAGALPCRKCGINICEVRDQRRGSVELF